MKWYYAQGKEKVGPHSEQEIEELAREGKITAETYVWNESLPDWRPYGTIKASEPVTEPASQGVTASHSDATGEKAITCSECGGTFAEDEVIRYGDSNICASCKPVFLQKVKEGAKLQTEMEYAGFWIRFGAKFIDGIVLTVVNMIIGFVINFGVSTSFAVTEEQTAATTAAFAASMIGLVVQMTIALLYSTIFVGKYAATPGKMACGLKIVTPDGGRVSYGRALGRHFAEFLSSITLSIGYLMAAFDEEKRALHDRVCSTRVIKK